MSELLTAEKSRIRAQVRAARQALTAEALAATRAALGARLSALTTELGARSVGCYLPVAGEPDTRDFLDWASTTGVEVLLPSSRADGQLDWVWAGDAAPIPGAFGIPEPVGERLPPQTIAGVDLLLIPACAVDVHGRRLGWGRGYFDRALGALDPRPPVYAVVYENEVLSALPEEPHDVPVAGAVTPQRVLRF